MKQIKVDVINNTLTMTRAFAKKASDPYSSEYAKLQEIIERFPKIKVQNHTIKKNPNKEHYKGLTYDYMRRYILFHESEETVAEAIAEFEDILFDAEGHTVRYPNVKKWFLDKYKDFSRFGMEEDVEIAKRINTKGSEENLLEVA